MINCDLFEEDIYINYDYYIQKLSQYYEDLYEDYLSKYS